MTPVTKRGANGVAVRAPWRVILWLGAAALGVSLAVTARLRGGAGVIEDALPLLGEVPAFSLTDATGVPFGRAQLAGRIWTANLFFTSCQSICPTITRRLATLQNGVGRTTAFDLVSISVDPEQDTPAVMSAFAAEYGADATRWHFLTGPLGVIAGLSAQGLKLGALDEPSGHPTYIALVDRRGFLRGYYDGLDAAAMARLERDIGLVAGEKSGSQDTASGLPVPGLGPKLTVALNSLNLLLLLAGFWAIKRKRVTLHRRIMLGALATSTVFLVVYLTNHALNGSTRYPLHDWTRTLYFWVLIPHTILAAVIVPFILRGVWLAWRERFDAHKRLMRWVWPAWLYVSLTGVVVYMMLYVLPRWRG